MNEVNLTKLKIFIIVILYIIICISPIIIKWLNRKKYVYEKDIYNNDIKVRILK